MYYGMQFSRGHFNRHTAVDGTIRVGDEEWNLEAFGWRDHSWGPRYWQAIWAYRLFIANFGPDRALMLLKNMMPDGSAHRLGVRTANRAVVIEGRVLTMAPLRNRRKAGDEVLLSRVAEGFTEYTWDGRNGYGIMEYIERVEDGVAVGHPL